MNLSRRDLVKLGAAVPVSRAGSLIFAKINSKFEGVMIGAQTYSFRRCSRPLRGLCSAMKRNGLGYASCFKATSNPPIKPIASTMPR